jgi:hypothetical protein
MGLLVMKRPHVTLPRVSAMWVAVLVLLLGAGLVVAGVAVLAGPGWALIAAGVALVVLALVVLPT